MYSFETEKGRRNGEGKVIFQAEKEKIRAKRVGWIKIRNKMEEINPNISVNTIND